jgi:hypothetical protein
LSVILTFAITYENFFIQKLFLSGMTNLKIFKLLSQVKSFYPKGYIKEITNWIGLVKFNVPIPVGHSFATNIIKSDISGLLDVAPLITDMVSQAHQLKGILVNSEITQQVIETIQCKSNMDMLIKAKLNIVEPAQQVIQTIQCKSNMDMFKAKLNILESAQKVIQTIQCKSNMDIFIKVKLNIVEPAQKVIEFPKYADYSFLKNIPINFINSPHTTLFKFHCSSLNSNLGLPVINLTNILLYNVIPFLVPAILPFIFIKGAKISSNLDHMFYSLSQLSIFSSINLKNIINLHQYLLYIPYECWLSSSSFTMNVILRAYVNAADDIMLRLNNKMAEWHRVRYSNGIFAVGSGAPVTDDINMIPPLLFAVPPNIPSGDSLLLEHFKQINKLYVEIRSLQEDFHTLTSHRILYFLGYYRDRDMAD